jgi:hypothetical protein
MGTIFREDQTITSNNFINMKLLKEKLRKYEEGKIGWALLWLLGVPLPILLILYFIFGRD